MKRKNQPVMKYEIHHLALDSAHSLDIKLKVAVHRIVMLSEKKSLPV